MLVKFLSKFPTTKAWLNRDRVVLLFVVFVYALLHEFMYLWPNILNLTNSSPFVVQTSEANLSGTKLWDDLYQKHGFDTTKTELTSLHNTMTTLNKYENENHDESTLTQISQGSSSDRYDANRTIHGKESDSVYNAPKSWAQASSISTCEDFFTVWPSDCTDKLDDLHLKLGVLSAQMTLMNTTLTVYVTDEKMCEFPFTSILIEKIDLKELLVEHGFQKALKNIDEWPKNKFTRISDVLRLALASKYSKTYIDIDVTFLRMQKELYQRSFVGAAIWKDAKNAIELTNGIFCLPQHVLLDMMGYQRQRILHGKDEYFYTELGPSMFHNVLMNRHEVMMYSHNNPTEASLDGIARAIHQYGHMHLHLTGHVRKGNSHLNFGDIVNKIRRKAGLPMLQYPHIRV